MPDPIPVPIAPPPGVVITETGKVAAGRWTACDAIHFVRGQPQKIGGWVRQTATPTSGQPRAAHAWRDNSANQFIAVGTYRKLYAYDTSLAQNDITPFRATGTLGNNPFTTTSGSPNVAVNHSGHGLGVGDTVIYAGASSSGNDGFTKILLHLDGANGSTTIADTNAGGSAHAWTAHGSAAISTAQSKFGGASLSCPDAVDGTDYVSTPASTDFNVGSSDFTVDCWINRQGGDGTNRVIVGQTNLAITDISWNLRLSGSNTLLFQYTSDGTTGTLGQLAGVTAITTTGWHHVAVVRHGNTLSLYLDGVLENSAAISGSIWASSSLFTVGRFGSFTTFSWNGFIDEFRLSVGIARWTANSTPPAAPYFNVNPNGAQIVASVIDANNYTFALATAALASERSGGAAVTYQYEITVGTELGTQGTGFGVGQYGGGNYGDPRSGSTIFFEPRFWSLDHFGQLLLAAYNGGAIYVFDPTVPQPWPRAVLAASDPAAPTDCRFVFVTQERFVVALRAGMAISWCSQGDYTTWTPSPTNTANSRTLTVGTKLVAGRVLGPFLSLIWSDAAAYLMQWTGSLYVYNTSILATECGLISPGAAVTVNGVAYWMGFDNFFMYDGAVHPIPNVEDIRKSVFDAVDKLIGSYQCHAIYVPKYNRIDFHYTTSGNSNPTLLARYHINDQCWAPGVIGGTRCSGTHFQQGDTRVIAFDVDGYGYQHDNGNDANGAALPWNLTLAPFALDKSLSICEIDGIESDFKDQVGNITFTLATYDRLGDAAPEDSETETVSPGDQLIDWRSSGRYLSLAISSADLGSYFRWGVPQAYVKPLGMRR